ncbi:MAG: hypothetical protein AVDCRST_MAG47-1399, partial [uncultured Nocardioidaceae bacterium]
GRDGRREQRLGVRRRQGLKGLKGLRRPGPDGRRRRRLGGSQGPHRGDRRRAFQGGQGVQGHRGL